jgi:CheY-like chemotaxis protein
MIRFEIEDTGPGIDSDSIKEIFLPFHQVGDPAKQKEGTGLGLAISQRIIRMMGAEIHVNSKINKGSFFWFELSFPAVSWRRNNLMQDESKTIIGYKGNRLTVQIVDDKSENREVLKDILSPLGFDIMEAGSGTDAIEQAKTRRPNIVLLDVNMPDMDGYETAQCFRRNKLFDRVRLVAVCDTLTEDNQTMCQQSGFNGHTLKPVHINHLLSTIQEQTSLKWIYEEDTSLKPEKQEEKKQAFITPPLEILNSLYRLSKQGDLIEIQQQAKKMMQDTPEWTPFCEQLIDYASKFMVNRLKSYIEKHLKSKNVRT